MTSVKFHVFAGIFRAAVIIALSKHVLLFALLLFLALPGALTVVPLKPHVSALSLLLWLCFLDGGLSAARSGNRRLFEASTLVMFPMPLPHLFLG